METDEAALRAAISELSLVESILRELTQLESNWISKVELVSQRDYYGRKKPDCCKIPTKSEPVVSAKMSQNG